MTLNPPSSGSEKNKSSDFCSSLLSRMTLEEKVGQMVQADLSWDQDVKQLLKEGRIGSLLSIRDPYKINEHQRIVVEESRLGVPIITGNDIIHGYRTTFPIPLALSCTWNTDLIEEVARVSIAEAVAGGTNWNFAPMVDISRDPRWGRIAEGAGEDPLLGSRISQAWVKGYQDYEDAAGRKAAACVKHYAAYGAAEAGKDYNTVDMSERRLREEYLPTYRAAVEAGVKTLMTSFNDLNGIPTTANVFLLRQILRQEWGFEGLVVSDYDSIGELILHGLAKDHREAALRSILAGVDMDMMGNAYHFHLANLVRDGEVPESLVDEAVMRILKLKVELGLFEHPYLDEESLGTAFLQKGTLELAARTAAESTVLLKNENNLLPLQAAGKTIALIGPMAVERQSLLGCWSFAGQAEDVETLQEALIRYLPSDSRLIVAEGCGINDQQTDFSAAVEAASQADIVLLALGEADTMSGEAHSRAHLGLPGSQQALFEQIKNTGKPLVTLLFSGRPLAIPELAAQTDALLLAWHGGTCAAQGLCDVLLGWVNPSAKLSASFPRSVGQIPLYYAYKSTGRPFDSSGTLQFNEAHKSAYLDESNLPLFPFGFGLSYTSFEYTDLEVSTPRVQKDGQIKVSALISNKGDQTGTEIVQLYVRDLVGSVTRPVKELKDFCRVKLDAGESRRVEFILPAEKLAFLGPDLRPMLEAGEYKVWIAPHSAGGLEGEFKLVD